MASEQPRNIVREPLGNLCVIRDESLRGWSVKICTGVVSTQEHLADFGTRSEAEAFAQTKLQSLNAKGGTRYILNVDDCPCWQKEM